jgi:hypothetical protein
MSVAYASGVSGRQDGRTVMVRGSVEDPWGARRDDCRE